MDEKVLIEDVWEAFRIRWHVSDDVVAKAEVFAISGGDGMGTFDFLRNDWVDSGETTTDIDDAEPYLKAMVKWDGCSHLDFGRGGYLHFCGAADYTDHVALMRWLFERAFNLMGRELGVSGPWRDA